MVLFVDIALGQVSSSHADKDALKTDATPDVMWDILRAWIKLHPVKAVKADSVATRLLAVEPKREHSFKLHPEANPSSRASGISRFQQNPLPNWGPKARAKKRKPTTSSGEDETTSAAAGAPDSHDAEAQVCGEAAEEESGASDSKKPKTE